jgi:hypothetical protein
LPNPQAFENLWKRPAVTATLVPPAWKSICVRDLHQRLIMHPRCNSCVRSSSPVQQTNRSNALGKELIYPDAQTALLCQRIANQNTLQKTIVAGAAQSPDFQHRNRFYVRSPLLNRSNRRQIEPLKLEESK